MAQQNNKIMLAKNRILEMKAKQDSAGVSAVNAKRSQALTAPHKPTTNKRNERRKSSINEYRPKSLLHQLSIALHRIAQCQQNLQWIFPKRIENNLAF